MANCYYHAVSSAHKWGGKWEDYIRIHEWFDESKGLIADVRHRALRHHAEGIFMCSKTFGDVITNSDGIIVPVRLIGELHVKEDLNRIPSFQDWMVCLRPEPWMLRAGKLFYEEPHV